MLSADIRERFLSFYEARGHRRVPSSPLVPDDATLLFVNAGMVQFKDLFLGLERRGYSRAVSSQKCMRVSGKHNDLENVGPSPRHHTFFEMLGNFSFGDYFKSEAIAWAWSFATDELRIDPGLLVATVHREDEDAYRLWREQVGLPDDQIVRMGDKTNFWMMADVGPCGPTSEIHYDYGPKACTCGRPDCSVGLDNGCERWLEVWNLVFMQYDQAADGTRQPLPNLGVDTGMGLERIAAVMQGARANYDTDLFVPIMDRLQALLGHDANARQEAQTGYRVIVDHGRAMTFLIADGVMPGNDGRSYVLRLIMRRAMRFGRMIGFDGPFLGSIADGVIELMRGAYPDLDARRDWVLEVVAEEEARFARTLQAGLAILEERVAYATAEGESRLSGAVVFQLYDTYGFPPDLTRAVAEESGLAIDHAGFEAAMEEQRARGRAGSGFTVDDREAAYRRLELPETRFAGYRETLLEASVMALATGEGFVQRADEGTAVEVVLEATPFYAESGGQVGDIGTIETPKGRVEIHDTQRVGGLIVHLGRVASGEVRTGDGVIARVDAERRDDVRRNHTATHLLHAALREVVGEHAEQRGSLVAGDRLRFDFAHLRALEPRELRAIERHVNAAIRADLPVADATLSIDEARREGATMLFGEKYGDQVRVVSVGDISKELCGGTHLGRTGEIGAFLLLGERSVGAGLRRIEALTGRWAEAEARRCLDRLDAIVDLVGGQSPDELEPRLSELLNQNRELSRDLERARGQLASAAAGKLARQVRTVEGVKLLAARVELSDAEALRSQAEAVRDAVGDAVIALGAVIEDRPRIVVMVAEPLVARGLHAGRLVKLMAPVLGGGGGGRPTMAEAGGKDPSALDAALEGLETAVAEELAEAAAG